MQECTVTRYVLHGYNRVWHTAYVPTLKTIGPSNFQRDRKLSPAPLLWLAKGVDNSVGGDLYLNCTMADKITMVSRCPAMHSGR